MNFSEKEIAQFFKGEVSSHFGGNIEDFQGFLEWLGASGVPKDIATRCLDLVVASEPGRSMKAALDLKLGLVQAHPGFSDVFDAICDESKLGEHDLLPMTD